jgi:gliding motility-associated-like protein
MYFMSFNLMPNNIPFLKKAYFVGLVAWITISIPSFSQNLSQHNWYFGNSPDGIRFNRGTNQATTVKDQFVPFGTGGSAVATDPATANLLFYTDGLRVYDASHKQMPNGTGLSGNTSANQPAVTCPVPGQPNKYFIFTNSANFTTGGSINVSVVNMTTLFGNALFPSPPLGDIESSPPFPIQKNTAVPGLSNRSEGMIILPHANGTDYWLITHQNGSSNFMTTLINAASYSSGTFNTIVNSIAGPAGALSLTVSNFSYNHKLRKLAVATQSKNDFAQILDFDPNTGNITFDRYILNTGSNLPVVGTEWIYDIQWDIKGGQYLYISRIGDGVTNADVFQYDYVNSNPNIPTTITTSLYTATSSSLPARSYGLQLAPDSAIYHIYQATVGGPFLIDKFTKTDTLAAFVKITQPFGTTDFAGRQFPSFFPRSTVSLTANFTTSAAPRCQNNPITFFPTITPNADSLLWNFGDGQSSKAWSPVHKFTTLQPSFNVQLTAFYQGQRVTTTQAVTITPFDLRIQLVQDTTACKSEFPPPRGTSTPTQFSVTVRVTQGTATSYTWSNGQTGPTLKPDSAGYYYVVVSNGTCSTYAGVNVKEYGLQDQRSNIWYFGNKAGIDFNKAPPVALNNSAMNAPAGCAIVCDRNGNTVFYTDGTNVYDKTNILIDTGIGGDPTSTQSSLIVSVPGDETIYYIFTTQEITATSLYELRYSVFDLKVGTNGSLTQKNILLYTKSTERITSNGRWLVTHEYGNSTFRTYRITAQGIGQPVYSDIGSVHSFTSAANGQGYMKMGPRNNLAVALSTPSTSNILELFQLNDTTGMLRNYRKVDMNQPNGQVYGVEFSPGGRKLFATVKGSPSPSEIFEYSIDSLERVRFKQKVSKPNELGALQIAPNGQIYMAYNDTPKNAELGNFQAVEDTLLLTPLNTINPFALAAGTNSRLGLPNFVQQQGNGFGGPGFTFAGLCIGDTTKFNGTPTDAIDQFQWAFGDGAGSTVSSPNHLYASAGTYTVSMRLTNRCGLDTTIVKTVIINPKPPPPTILPAISLCNGPIDLDAGPAVNYEWSNGSTNRTITGIVNPGVFTVTTTDANGCKARGTSIVADNRPKVNLGPDIEVCQNSAVANLDAQNPGSTFVWTITDLESNAVTPGETISTQSVSTIAVGKFKYEVTVTDPVTACFVKNDKIVDVKVSPSLAFGSIIDPNCGSTNGSFEFQINPTTPPSGLYSYSISGPFSGPSDTRSGLDQNAPVSIAFSGVVGAGIYSGIVTDQVSGCTSSLSIGVADSAVPFSVGAAPLWCDDTRVTVTGPTVPELRYSIRSQTGSLNIVRTSASSSEDFTLPPDNYIITIQENNGTGCTATNTYTVPVSTLPVVIISSDLCGSPPNLQASPQPSTGVTSFDWILPNGTKVNTPSSLLNLVGANAMNGKYTSILTLVSGCRITADLDVVMTQNFSPTINQNPVDGCASSAILTVTPTTGNYVYRWFVNGAPTLLGGSKISISTADNGIPLSVDVVEGVNGCVKTANITPVLVGPVDASVTATQACDDGKDFTLTATTTASGVAYSWFFNNSTTAISGETSATLNRTDAGTYRVRVSKATCSADASIQIIKAPLPQGQLVDAVIICADNENQDPATNQVDLNPGSFATYNWFRDGSSLGYTNRIFNATSAGTYRVDLTNSFGCTNSDQTKVLDECLPKIVAPNAFRPSSIAPQYSNKFGDFTNKEFFLYSYFISDNFEIAIYNRWGELVFQSSDKDFRWNGGYNNNGGQPLPGGTYTYVVRYQSSYRPQDGTKEQRGGVVLLR